MSMPFMPHFHKAAAAAGLAFFYASGYSSADIYDAGNIHSGGTITIPSDWNGRYVRQTVGLHNSGGGTVVGGKSGGTYDGKPSAVAPNAAGIEDSQTAMGAPVLVATGETFTGANGSSKGAFNCVELIALSHKMALVNRSGTSFNVGTAATVVQWNNEVYDTDGYHDNSTNPSRLTVPSGSTGLVRVVANIECAASGTELGVQILKNGSVLYEMDTSGTSMNVCSPPTTVSTGDYFEVAVRTASATNVTVSNVSWFFIEELPSTLSYLTGSLTASGLTAGTTLATQAGSLTVPAGVTRIRAGFFGVKSSNTGSIRTWIRVNGSDVQGMASSSSNTTGQDFNHGVSSILEVTPGDTISFQVATDAGAQSYSGSCWIEEVPAVTA